jgi:hypothetical protein
MQLAWKGRPTLSSTSTVTIFDRQGQIGQEKSDVTVHVPLVLRALIRYPPVDETGADTGTSESVFRFG